MSSREVQKLPFQLLKNITDDFSEKKKVGSGGYGEVYKAVLNGEEVAVKKLFFMLPGHEDDHFQNEFRNLMKVQHKNIIRLFGYCYDISHTHIEYQGELVFAQIIERALCFEYMQQGSLSEHISDESCIHDWPTTYKIIKGTCEGLHYLHKGQGEKNSIFHLNLKPSNILLDKYLVPKITGFGLSMFIDDSDTETEATTVRGTHWFMPPEFINSRIITAKNDVFALGVTVYHIMAGKKGYHDYTESSYHNKFSKKPRQEFIESVQEYWKKKMQTRVGYTWGEPDMLEVTKCIEIAMSCVESDRDERPTTTAIINDLNKLDSRINEMSIVRQIGTNAIHTEFKEVAKQIESNPHHLPLQHFQNITSNFSEERILGRGGFGVVYKGVLQDGEMVAVKKILQSMPSSEQQFENEVNLLMELKHPNVVRLVGYCYETKRLHTPHEGKSVFAWNTESLLCLEYLPNGSLEKYISDASSGLDWHTRHKIIEGVSYGLQYLHEQSSGPIMHLDLKPANILLDENMVAKITDFGLSRLTDRTQTICTIHTSGTLGYMPPEYLRGKISLMSDIYSLGVIIMEVITGHRDYPYDIRALSEGFIELEHKKWRTMLQKKSGYASLEIDCQQIRRCIQVGLICVNPERTKRPTIKQVIDMLQGAESMDWYITNELSSPGIQAEP